MQFVHRCVTIEKNRSAKRERRFTMRKYDREITFFDEILKFPDVCDTVRLGINGGDYSYVVPLSFGYEPTSDKK